MTVNAEKIRLGSCDVTFDGSDLGSTKGGVEVEISTETYQVKTDQTGETPLKDIITGTTVTVKVPMSETDLGRLQKVMPQSVLQAVSTTTPTGWTVDLVAGYGVGDTSVVLDSGTNDLEVGETFTFANHATVYRVTAVSTDTPLAGENTVTFVQDATGSGGLVAAVVDNEAVTVITKDQGVEIRTGVNIDLLDSAAALKLHPTGLDTGNTEQDFYAWKAAPTANFSFKYELQNERVYEVTFNCYPDTANNNRIAVFGQPAS